MKKSVAFLIILAIVFSLSTFASADVQNITSAEASTMRLMRTNGIVSVMDESKNSLPIREGMRLASGSSLTTEAQSRAGIMLDDNKAVTLDSFSTADLLSTGKKLELNLRHGAMFFSVSKPLDA